MTEERNFESLKAHLSDLQEKSERWHKSLASAFMEEEELAAMKRVFPASAYIVYDGGYEDARKQKVIFRYDPEDDFSDVVCMKADLDQRFRKIGHRDVHGALMHLGIERSTFGDFWIEEDAVYLYTSQSMVQFFEDHLNRINQLTVSFYPIDEHPVQHFETRKFTVVVASERMDAIVAGLSHVSRSKAREMIQQGLVQCDHVLLEAPDRTAYNNVTISIRGVGRFTFLGVEHNTRSGRIAAEFVQYV